MYNLFSITQMYMVEFGFIIIACALKLIFIPTMQTSLAEAI